MNKDNKTENTLEQEANFDKLADEYISTIFGEESLDDKGIKQSLDDIPLITERPKSLVSEVLKKRNLKGK